MEFEAWNAELIHENALAAAQLEHQKIRESALRVIELHRLRVEREFLRRQAKEEETRLRIAQEKAQEAERIRIAQEQARIAEEQARKAAEEAKKAATPPPPPPPPSPPKPASPVTAPQPPHQVNGGKALATPPAPKPSTPAAHAPPFSPLAPETAPRQNGQAVPSTQQQLPTTSLQSSAGPKVSSIATTTRKQVKSVFPIDEYAQIHKNLKQLRRGIATMSAQNNDFKKKVGEMRREIRKSVGQLRDGKGANTKPNQKIFEMLDQALVLPTPAIDPRSYTIARPEPVEGATQNGDTLPSLFIYLLNIYAKAIVSQFVEEAGVSPKAAEPIGMNASMIFSRQPYCWRGKSLIDILIAKIRASCPVLFGIRGNEKTEEGRARLGWKKEGGNWVPEQVHNTRMTGIGAGYAAISLRDYSKSVCANPYPPTRYWTSMSLIVATPPEEAASTQYTVLKAMIENYEEKFLRFYGSSARAALRIALVDWPGRAVQTSAAVGALRVLADKLQRDYGLDLTNVDRSLIV
ncbi:GLE1-like protein [Xylogone sp. PMI_703]|nr:GLE1-like protein [Xylogone sp. PMI_703]